MKPSEEYSAQLNLLIDKASAIAGSDYKLAKLLGIPPQHISAWRHGGRTATPADHALLAYVAGVDPVAELARATVAQNEGKRKGDLLMRALGKSLLATGAAVASAGASAASIFSTVPAPTHLLEWVVGLAGAMCIMSTKKWTRRSGRRGGESAAPRQDARARATWRHPGLGRPRLTLP